VNGKRILPVDVVWQGHHVLDGRRLGKKHENRGAKPGRDLVRILSSSDLQPRLAVQQLKKRRILRSTFSAAYAACSRPLLPSESWVSAILVLIGMSTQLTNRSGQPQNTAGQWLTWPCPVGLFCWTSIIS
jgi:hypothetical protein